MFRSIATNANREIALSVSNAQRANELIPPRTLSYLFPLDRRRLGPAARGVVGRFIFSGAYSDCASNLLMYLGAESAVSSEIPLKLLSILVDFDSTICRFESSRPNRHLANEIRRFLISPDFHSDGLA